MGDKVEATWHGGDVDALRAEVERLRAGLYPLSQYTPKSAWALAEDIGASEDSLLVAWINATRELAALRAGVEALATGITDEMEEIASAGHWRALWINLRTDLRALLVEHPTPEADHA